MGMGNAGRRIGAVAAVAGLVWLCGMAGGGGAQSPAEGGSVKPMPSPAQPASPAPQATASAAELAPGVVFEVVELRRMPERGFVQLRVAVNNTTGADASLKRFGLAYDASSRKSP
jgi:hypothetical protein